MALSPTFSKITRLFKVRMICRKSKWRSSSEKYWNSKIDSFRSTLQTSGTLKQPSKLWNHSLKPPSVFQCLKKLEMFFKAWMASSMKTSASSDLILMKWKPISSILLNNSRSKRSNHWSSPWSRKKSKFKKSFRVLTISRANVKS